VQLPDSFIANSIYPIGKLRQILKLHTDVKPVRQKWDRRMPSRSAAEASERAPCVKKGVEQQSSSLRLATIKWFWKQMAALVSANGQDNCRIKTRKWECHCCIPA
jgi:hypothetical protein